MDDLPLACFDDVPEDLCCSICQMPKTTGNVLLCRNSHNACRVCADTMRSDRSTCPVCSVDFLRPSGDWMANRLVDSMVSDVLLNCPHKGEGCDHRCKMVDMAAHTAVCKYTVVPCPCAQAGGDRGGCEWRGARHDLDGHLACVDHSRWIVGMISRQTAAAERLTAHVKDLDERFTSYRAAAAAAVSHDEGEVRSLKRDVDAVSKQCTRIIGFVDRQDGSSVRSRQRDKKNSKDVADAQKERDEAVAEKEQLQADLARRQTELNDEAERFDRLNGDKGDLETQKAELIRRNEAQAVQVATHTTDLKRVREERDGHAASSKRANTTLHEQHSLLLKMLPSAASRCCPCSACRRRDPGSPKPVQRVAPAGAGGSHRAE